MDIDFFWVDLISVPATTSRRILSPPLPTLPLLLIQKMTKGTTKKEKSTKKAAQVVSKPVKVSPAKPAKKVGSVLRTERNSVFIHSEIL